MKAAYTTHNSFDEWAKAGLDRLADIPAIPIAAGKQTPYKVTKK
jgi:hypothetical protein